MVEEAKISQAGQAARKRSQVEEKMDILNSSLGSIENSAKEIEDRLSAILTESIPTCEAEIKEPEQLVKLASDLKSFHSRCANTNRILISILQRLELYKGGP